jgi:hypothetical protein
VCVLVGLGSLEINSIPLPKKARKKLPVIFFMVFSKLPPRIRGLEKTIKKITGSFFLAFLGRGRELVCSWRGGTALAHWRRPAAARPVRVADIGHVVAGTAGVSAGHFSIQIED